MMDTVPDIYEQIACCTGESLDKLMYRLGCYPRLVGEPDSEYRKRIITYLWGARKQKPSRPKSVSNKPSRA